jgi:hypothetical protein
LQSPRSCSSKVPGCLAGHERRSRELRYVSAATLVAAGLLVRFILQPVLDASLPYAAFYPVVLISAYALGPRPAALAAILSGALAYGGFDQPAALWTWGSDATGALLVFLGVCAVAIGLVGVLTRYLETLADRKAEEQLPVTGSADVTLARLKISEPLVPPPFADAIALRAGMDPLAGRSRVGADQDSAAIARSFPRTAKVVGAPPPERALAGLR